MDKLKKWSWTVLLPVAFACGALVAGGGCCSAELVKQAQLSEARAKRFVQLMDAGETTRTQEQDFVRACDLMFREIRAATGADPVAE